MEENFSQLMSTIGYPATMSVVLASLCHWLIKQNREDTMKREERLFQQLEKFTDTLNNFNDTLIRIDARIEALEKHVNIC